MKKLVCLSLILLAVLSCFTACNFNQTVSGMKDKAESTPKVEEMMTVLTEKRTSDAKALMHPQVAENADRGIDQMQTYLSGREVSEMDLQNINVTTSFGTSGNAKQERVSYKVTLSDGEIIYLNVVYLSNNNGNGFISFQLVLGAI